MCDIRIASEKASFAESFIKVGIVPGDGGAWLLPRVVGMSMAPGDELHRRNPGRGRRRWPPASCPAWSPQGELMAAARDLAGRIAANPPDASA